MPPFLWCSAFVVQRLTFDTLLAHLEGLPGQTLCPQQVGRVLRGVALQPESLAPNLWCRPGGYTRNRVHGDARLEVLVLCWEAGAALRGCGSARGAHVAWPGAVDRRAAEAGVHRVRALEGPAVAVHVYSRPVEQMRVLDLQHERCETRAVRDDTVRGVPLPGRARGLVHRPWLPLGAGGEDARG